MAVNGISYVGRLVNNKGQVKWGQSRNGNPVLEVVIAEDHQERNDRAPQQYQDRTKPTDAYVRTTTSWHRVTMFGDVALEMATDPDFNHGALVEVTNAQYREEAAWKTKDGVERAGRPETIGKDSFIGVFEGSNGQRYGARDEWNVPIHDGGDIPELKGQRSGGGGGGREYADDEGF